MTEADEAKVRANRIALAEAFEVMAATPGWQLYTTMLEQTKADVALSGHRDLTKRPGYYEGFLDAIDQLMTVPATLIEETRQARVEERKAAEAEKARRQARERFAGSDFDPARIRVGTFGQGDPDELGG